MTTLLGLRLMRLFAFYLAAMFFIGLALRVRQYRTILTLVATFKGRWPRLYQLVKAHHGIFLSWGTVLPLALTLGLWLLNTIASQFIWPEAGDLSLGGLIERTPALFMVCLSWMAMVG